VDQQVLIRHIILVFLIVAGCLACDPLANPVSGRIEFSSDTVSFDTVFSGVGSATREFRAINRGKEPVLIDRIWLAGGEASPFRLNINGVPSTEADNLLLAQGDSLFVFVEVTVDPTGEDSPVAVIDSVVFMSGSYVSRVILEAWGQEIRLVEGDIYGNVTWSEGRPYVIRGSLFIDTTAVLTMEPGTRVYFHYDAGMTVAGALRALGTAEKPVLMATDRIEKEYTDVPGRWKGLLFLDCSRGNRLQFTEVRNAAEAVRISGSEGSQPDVTFHGARLMHNSVASLVAHHADVSAVNSLFAHSGFSTVSLTGGGSGSFIHCTVMNRWEYGYRTEPAMFIGRGDGTLPDVTVLNSVLSGTLNNEIIIDADRAEAAGSFRADSSMIRIDTLAADWFSSPLFRDVFTTGTLQFIDETAWDYRPDTLSPLLDIAGREEAVAWPYDIRQMPRPSGDGPDIGAFERQPGEKRPER
jgi:hypothetical protein